MSTGKDFCRELVTPPHGRAVSYAGTMHFMGERVDDTWTVQELLGLVAWQARDIRAREERELALMRAAI